MARYGRRSRISRWSGVEFTTCVAVSALKPETLEALAEIYKPDPVFLEFDEMEITGSSCGYDDPGRTMGDPERCYPPEGDEEREIVEVQINTCLLKDGDEVATSIAVPETLFAVLRSDPIVEKAVKDAELPRGYDEPDYDEDREFNRPYINV